MRFPLIFAALAAFSACKSKTPQAEPPAPIARPALDDGGPASPPDPPEGFGTIEGTVTVTGDGKMPAAPNMKSDPYCAQQAPPVPSVVIDAEGRLSNAVISVTDVVYLAVQSPTADTVLTIDQEGCGYKPRIAASQARMLAVSNSDVTMHNVHAYRDGRNWFNIAQPPGAGRYERTIEAGIVKLGCDVHPWMAAYVHVFDHPYYAITVAGKFSIANVPAGERQVAFWHEVFGQQTTRVTVVPNGTSVVTFSITADVRRP